MLHVIRSVGAGWLLSWPAGAEVDAWGHFLEGTGFYLFYLFLMPVVTFSCRSVSRLFLFLCSWWLKKASGTRTGPRSRVVVIRRSDPPCSRKKTQRNWQAFIWRDGKWAVQTNRCRSMLMRFRIEGVLLEILWNSLLKSSILKRLLACFVLADFFQESLKYRISFYRIVKSGRTVQSILHRHLSPP